MTKKAAGNGNLWLAEELWQLDAIEFGDFTLGRTAVNSPLYINVRRLISKPRVLKRCASIIKQELETLLSMKNPHVQPFSVMCGVPFGGLHIGTALSLDANIPMIYIHPPASQKSEMIEGNYVPGQTCLVVDDLITGGGSILQAARTLGEAGLVVRDAVAVIDRQEGGRDALKAAGINLISILTLEQIANYLMAAGHIQEAQYRATMEYLERTGSL